MASSRKAKRPQPTIWNWHVLAEIFGIVDGNNKMNNKYSGSNFDAFLEEEGILEEVSTAAQKRLLSLQIANIMAEENLTKSEVASRMNTSRSQLDRLLDPDNTSITLESLDRLARAIGRQLRIEFA
jgi:antitoxin HicB